MNEKLQKIVFSVGLIAVVSGALYLFVDYSNRKNKKRVNTVNLNYEYSKGIIEDYKSYKGHSIKVKYRIGDKFYKFSGGWDINPKCLGEGDSIRFRYSIKNPELIITELENEF